jgi:hypothetical protein
MAEETCQSYPNLGVMLLSHHPHLNMDLNNCIIVAIFQVISEDMKAEPNIHQRTIGIG